MSFRAGDTIAPFTFDPRLAAASAALTHATGISAQTTLSFRLGRARGLVAYHCRLRYYGPRSACRSSRARHKSFARETPIGDVHGRWSVPRASATDRATGRVTSLPIPSSIGPGSGYGDPLETDNLSQFHSGRRRRWLETISKTRPHFPIDAAGARSCFPALLGLLLRDPPGAALSVPLFGFCVWTRSVPR